MQTRALTKADYDQIVRVIDLWWEGPSTALAHPIFFYELGELARVVEWDDGTMVGFMLGFVADRRATSGATRDAAEVSRIGYMHLIGIHPEYRRRGVARALYSAFEASCRAANCHAIKAITTHGNDGSVRFHLALGYTAANVEDYAGPGRARIVFEKALV
ncbi:MAG: GNAT family N-acetyltransferase [Myxococcales bacterium]|nr:GNAT family N-acetyltransferase [Myxococcales bacterium]